MNEEGDAVMEIWRNKFTGENSEQTKTKANEQSKFAKQLACLSGAGSRSVPRHNMRPCMVWVPRLVWEKNIHNLSFSKFLDYLLAMIL